MVGWMEGGRVQDWCGSRVNVVSEGNVVSPRVPTPGLCPWGSLYSPMTTDPRNPSLPSAPWVHRLLPPFPPQCPSNPGPLGRNCRSTLLTQLTDRF